MSRLNLGNLDRALRILFGLTLLALGAFGVIGAWGGLGVVPLFTGMWGLCPVYALFGLSTTSR